MMPESEKHWGKVEKKSLVKILGSFFSLSFFCQSAKFSSLNREIPELEGKGHEPSRAENCSARALARASSARAHHYYIGHPYLNL